MRTIGAFDSVTGSGFFMRMRSSEPTCSARPWEPYMEAALRISRSTGSGRAYFLGSVGGVSGSPLCLGFRRPDMPSHVLFLLPFCFMGLHSTGLHGTARGRLAFVCRN